MRPAEASIRWSKSTFAIACARTKAQRGRALATNFVAMPASVCVEARQRLVLWRSHHVDPARLAVTVETGCIEVGCVVQVEAFPTRCGLRTGASSCLKRSLLSAAAFHRALVFTKLFAMSAEVP